jgi:hypothetical protein
MASLQNVHLEMWLENVVRKTLRMLERPQKFAFEATSTVQKDIMGARNINVLVGEN